MSVNAEATQLREEVLGKEYGVAYRRRARHDEYRESEKVYEGLQEFPYAR
jgi:hypothetical protein